MKIGFSARVAIRATSRRARPSWRRSRRRPSRFTPVLWKLTDLLPAVFATILIALAWRGVAEQVSGAPWALTGLVARCRRARLVRVHRLALMLFGGQLVRQYDEVALDVPAAIALIERTLEEHPWGRFVEKFVVHVDFV